MKYKGINLKQADDRDDQLLCSVEFNNPDEDDKLLEKMEGKIRNLFSNFLHEVYMESVLDVLICVSCYDIEFNQHGIDILKDLYDRLKTLSDNDLSIKVTVSVHVDEERFKREDGSEYNEDNVDWEEFIRNLQY